VRSIARRHGGEALLKAEGEARAAHSLFVCQGLSRMSHILVVEDESHIAQGLRFNLEAEGHSVEIAEDGEDALNRMLVKNQLLIWCCWINAAGQRRFHRGPRTASAAKLCAHPDAHGAWPPEDVLKGFESGATIIWRNL